MIDAPKDEPFEDVVIFSNEDEKLKPLGKTLNSKNSKVILQFLGNEELTAQEISKKTELSLSLVIHHLNIMMCAGVVMVSKTKFNSKNRTMKYYVAKPGILILPEKAAEKARKSKSLSNALGRIMRFTGVGIAGAVSWFVIREYQVPSKPEGKIDPDAIVILDGAFSHVTDTLTGAYSIESTVISLIVPVMVVTTGILLERVLSKRFEKRKKMD